MRLTLISYGNASGPMPPFDILRLSQMGSLTLIRPTAVDYTVTAEELQMRAEDLFGWVPSGELVVLEPQVFEIDQIQQAFVALESRRTRGKVALHH